MCLSSNFGSMLFPNFLNVGNLEYWRVLAKPRNVVFNLNRKTKMPRKPLALMYSEKLVTQVRAYARGQARNNRILPVTRWYNFI